MAILHTHVASLAALHKGTYPVQMAVAHQAIGGGLGAVAGKLPLPPKYVQGGGGNDCSFGG